MGRKSAKQALSKSRKNSKEPNELTHAREVVNLLSGGAPRMKIVDQDKRKIAPEYPAELGGRLLLMKALGSNDLDF